MILIVTVIFKWKRHLLRGFSAAEVNYRGIYRKQVINYYKILTRFGRYCLRKIQMKRLKYLRWIRGELLCMPLKSNYPGGRDYHKMVSYFMSM
jgi:hypothetical protein